MKTSSLRRTGALVATLALAAGTLAATATTASAAGPTGVVSGTITLPGGALAPGTNLFFTDGKGTAPVSDDVNRNTSTEADGTYAVSLPVGTYTVEIEDTCNVYADTETTFTVTAGADLRVDGQFTTARPAGSDSFVCARVAPKVAGLPQVGVPLTVSAPVFAQPGVSVSYQWVRSNSSDDEDIPGATGTTYVPGTSDVGYLVSVRVTGVLPGRTTYVREVFPATGEVKRGDYVFSAGPRVNGAPAIGRTIAASPGRLVPGASVSYQWLRAGVALPGQTARTYRVAKADYKKKLTVVITYRTIGYKPVVRAVASPFLAKKKGKIAAKVSTGKRTATIKVAVSPKASKRSKGKIVVLEDGRTLKRASIKAGSTTVKVTGLKKGKHSLTIVYDGKKNIAGTTKTVRIKK